MRAGDTKYVNHFSIISCRFVLATKPTRKSFVILDIRVRYVYEYYFCIFFSCPIVPRFARSTPVRIVNEFLKLVSGLLSEKEYYFRHTQIRPTLFRGILDNIELIGTYQRSIEMVPIFLCGSSLFNSACRQFKNILC